MYFFFSNKDYNIEADEFCNIDTGFECYVNFNCIVVIKKENNKINVMENILTSVDMDSMYNVNVIVHNNTNKKITIRKGDSVAQLLCLKSKRLFNHYTEMTCGDDKNIIFKNYVYLPKCEYNFVTNMQNYNELSKICLKMHKYSKNSLIVKLNNIYIDFLLNESNNHKDMFPFAMLFNTMIHHQMKIETFKMIFNLIEKCQWLKNAVIVIGIPIEPNNYIVKNCKKIQNYLTAPLVKKYREIYKMFALHFNYKIRYNYYFTKNIDVLSENIFNNTLSNFETIYKDINVEDDIDSDNDFEDSEDSDDSDDSIYRLYKNTNIIINEINQNKTFDEKINKNLNFEEKNKNNDDLPIAETENFSISIEENFNKNNDDLLIAETENFSISIEEINKF
ncbi:orf18 [Artaxa digramma nucleopolyhedrovirus]|uniref:Orf18 n=1 Tax=Artaxa digramma nucleopolyhedrovirus TaxID=3070910 RepID=A0AAE6R7Q4_9ABAC|nr:orf18 [Euproctis digramma nucleopolyhedrovirus]QHB21677.1 orf18 [Artaxa digramma nucleopolyhedrovirus]